MLAETHLEKASGIMLDLDDETQTLFKPFSKSRFAEALHPVSKLADQPQLRTLSVGLIVAGLLARNRRLAKAGARMIIAHEAATFAKDSIKAEVDRTRPRSARTKREKEPRKGQHLAKELNSFPSGHSAGAIAAARAFSREFPEYAAAAMGSAGLLAFLQIVRCAHYPSDVAAGSAIGLVAEKAADLLWSKVVGA